MDSVPDSFLPGAPPAERIGVSFYRGERGDVERCARRLFGRKLPLWEYAHLAGAWGRVRVEVGTLDDGLYLETWDPVDHGYRAVERVRPARAGPVLVIDAMHILALPMRRRGLGLAVLRRKLASARRLGVSRIETTAGRRSGENGYYTWPRFGFDGPLPTDVRRILPSPLSHARRVLDLFECDGGRRWWAEHGTTVEVAFDLADRSRSWTAFSGYVHDKTRPNDALAPCFAVA